jgi:thymidylate synthase (FAD)
MLVSLMTDSNDYAGSIELLDCMGSDLDVANAARVSFGVEHSQLTDRDTKLIKYLWDNKHSTPFEHCVLKFRIEVPMFIAKQHMRHRTWSYNEISRRYTSENITMYTPSKFRQQASSNRQASTSSLVNPVIDTIAGEHSSIDITASELLKKNTEDSLKLYEALLNNGVCREQARGILPQNTFTKYIATANLLNVLKFLALRDKPEAQYEMQLLAKAMSTIVKEKFPVVFDAFNKVEEV